MIVSRGKKKNTVFNDIHSDIFILCMGCPLAFCSITVSLSVFPSCLSLSPLLRVLTRDYPRILPKAGNATDYQELVSVTSPPDS